MLGDLFACGFDAAGVAGEERRLTDSNADFFAEVAIGAHKKYSYRGTGGQDVDACVLTPPAFDPVRRYPLHDWGGVDYRDVMAGVDWLLGSDVVAIDETRMGVTGGSYGGYLTNWIIGQTDRCSAAAPGSPRTASSG